MLGRIFLAACALALVSGCMSSPGTTTSRYGNTVVYSPQRSSECVANASSCMYNGQYEPGERYYAEQEAKRLNHAEVERLKRISIR